MVTVVDTLSQKRVRHPEKANRPDSEVLKKPDWIRVKAPSLRGQSGDSLRGGRLSECRRMLEPEARKFYDFGCNMHPCMRLL